MSEKCVIFALPTDDPQEFGTAATIAAECGATHVVVTENLPEARWQFDYPGDPYPAWFAFHPGLLKTFVPEALRPFIDLDHAERVREILRDRCATLKAQGLKGAYHTTEPQVLPEAAFAKHPGWRGPRVDQPHRSRRARFAPCVATEEVRDLYREALEALFRECPEIDLFLFFTIDSGSGFCWAPALYPGANGCSRCDESDVGARAVEFVRLVGETAASCHRSVKVDLVEIEPRSWMKRAFARPADLARSLPEGLAINHREGPDGGLFTARRFESLFYNAFYPVVGLPRPVAFLRNLVGEYSESSHHTLCSFNDALNNTLNASVYRGFAAAPSALMSRALAILWTVAEDLAGAERAAHLVDGWMAIDDAERQLASLDFGPFLLMGGLLGRWLTRPFVPFPEDLEDCERAHFEPFLFQARDEASAMNLADIQAMRMFEGWSARLLVEQTVTVTLAHLDRARQAFQELTVKGGANGDSHALTVERIDLLALLLNNGRNAVAYQAQLDRIKTKPGDSWENAPPAPLGAPAPWELRDLTEIARREIENTVQILARLDRSPGRLLDLAPNGEAETIMRLTPALKVHLHAKIASMNRRWSDYNRLGLPANP